MRLMGAEIESAEPQGREFHCGRVFAGVGWWRGLAGIRPLGAGNPRNWGLVVCVGWLVGVASCLPVMADDGIDFFEKEVRPLLSEHCYECHSLAAKKLKGGLLLDSREGWTKGGDSGSAVVPGSPGESLLIEAVRYGNVDLEMPPKQKLSGRGIEMLVKWVEMGAPDPRTGPGQPVGRRTGLSVEEGRSFWSYRRPVKAALPEVGDAAWARGMIDRFILAKLEEEGLRPLSEADPATLVRRVYFDLIGLPPTIEEQDVFEEAAGKDPEHAWGRLVDQLLGSPRFGERWGRHWLDVARFGESVTLRGFVFNQAWRYRDYVIESFNRDLGYDQFIREQIAGDLLPPGSLEDQQRRRVATTFLALGNTNLEEQDKRQLDMDLVDEQLDVIGKAILGQTISCARCHDHKFDPIPTKDYYGLAGILKGLKALEHANVSRWVEVPLPVSSEEEAVYDRDEARVTEVTAEIKAIKERLARLKEPTGKATVERPAILPGRAFPGMVVDDAQSRAVGEWQHSQYTKRYIGVGYLHDQNAGKGSKTLTFQAEFAKAGRYEVRLAYTPGGSRAAQVPVTIFSADGETTVRVDERQDPPIEGRFVSLGTYRFEVNGQGFVIVANEGTTGYVTVDAVQFLPADDPAAPDEVIAGDKPEPGEDLSEPARRKAEQAELAGELKRLEARLKELKATGPRRPMVMSVLEGQPADIPVHIRGSVDSLGEIVPRGFLSVAWQGGVAPVIPSDASGRRELADWLSSTNNPLTPRVMVNRIWQWVFGEGLVRTPDNFGTTGARPSHPELLDWLTVGFMEERWSVKWLVREMVTSRVYRLQSRAALERKGNSIGRSTLDTRHSEVDPENRLFWRMHRRRLDAESIRDTMLIVSGRLDLSMGGPSFDPGLSSDYGFEFEGLRRGVYVPVFRNALSELFQVFDFADPSMVIGKRNVSTVAPQALFLMNHPFVREQAVHAARWAIGEEGGGGENRERVEGAYRLTLGRLPSTIELGLALAHLNRAGASELSQVEEAWTELYHALFGSMDFRFLD